MDSSFFAQCSWDQEEGIGPSAQLINSTGHHILRLHNMYLAYISCGARKYTHGALEEIRAHTESPLL